MEGGSSRTRPPSSPTRSVSPPGLSVSPASQRNRLWKVGGHRGRPFFQTLRARSVRVGGDHRPLIVSVILFIVGGGLSCSHLSNRRTCLSFYFSSNPRGSPLRPPASLVHLPWISGTPPTAPPSMVVYKTRYRAAGVWSSILTRGDPSSRRWSMVRLK